MDIITVRENGLRRVQIGFPEDEPKSHTQVKPEYEAACDINKIVKKHGIGEIPVSPFVFGEGQEIDFTSGNDLLEAMMKMQRVEDYFMDLPASTRNQFQNDPSRMIDFLMDSKNDEQAIKLGLKPKKAPVAPTAQPAGKPAPAGAPPA